jgi:hypothetical protein
MRVPDRTFNGTYTEAQWDRIATAIKTGLGHDSDEMTMDGEPWYSLPHCDSPPTTRVLPPDTITLRTHIQRTVDEVLRRPSSPPWASHEELEDLQRKTHDLRQAFAASRQPDWQFENELWDAPDTLARISAKLQNLIPHMPTRKQLARLNSYNAHRAHLLVDLWTVWTGLGGKPTGKAVEDFLRACIEPVLGPESPHGIRRWVERYFQGDMYFHY